MIGNDIVDLRDSDARPTERTAAFDARVFSAAENERIESSDDSIRMRWLSWSAKESAYKLLRQYSGAVRFAPRRYAVGFESPGRAMTARGILAGSRPRVFASFASGSRTRISSTLFVAPKARRSPTVLASSNSGRARAGPTA